VLFPQVTETPSREFIAAQLQTAGVKRLVVPRAARFAVPAAAVPVLGAANITAADTGLIPTLLGALADRRQFDSLVLTAPDLPGLAVFLDDPRNEYDRAAGIMLAVRYLAIPRDTAYMAEQAKAARNAAAGLRSWLAGQLAAQAALLTGITYQVTPIAETAAAAPPGAAVFLDLRGLGARARKELTAAEQMFWDRPPDPFTLKADGPGLLAALGDRDGLAVCCVTGEKLIPGGWVRLAAVQAAGKTDYVISNRDPGGRLVKTRRRERDASEWPLYADEEITPESEISVVDVDRYTAFKYRDLIVHRLAGGTTSERFYLLLADGRVISVFGLHFRDLVIGKTPYASLTFGVTIGSSRYARLGKLMMMAVTSREMQSFLLHTSATMLQRVPPRGIGTSSLTEHEEGKGSGRGVMKLIRREPRPGGGFHLRYEAEFRDDTWAGVMRDWHARQAHICRPDWDGPRLDPPQPPAEKRKRGRGAGRR
jgi:hypothetical protein